MIAPKKKKQTNTQFKNRIAKQTHFMSSKLKEKLYK